MRKLELVRSLAPILNFAPRVGSIAYVEEERKVPPPGHNLLALYFPPVGKEVSGYRCCLSAVTVDDYFVETEETEETKS